MNDNWKQAMIEKIKLKLKRARYHECEAKKKWTTNSQLIITSNKISIISVDRNRRPNVNEALYFFIEYMCSVIENDNVFAIKWWTYVVSWQSVCACADHTSQIVCVHFIKPHKCGVCECEFARVYKSDIFKVWRSLFASMTNAN